MCAAKSWNTKTVFDEKFETDFSSLAFGDEGVNIPKMFSKLMKLTANSHLYWLVRWYSENIIQKEKTQFTMIEPEISPKDNANEALRFYDYIKKLASVHPEKEEQYESLAVAFGICGALNILSNAIVRERKLNADQICLIEEKLREYHEVWMRDNKESEFYEIQNFVRDIIEHLGKV